MNKLILIIVIITPFFYDSQCTLKNSVSNYRANLTSTGNKTLDNFINSEKEKMEQFFNVKVDLKIASGSNGFAMPSCKNYNCNGTIELGKNLILTELKKSGPISGNLLGKNMIMAIMAHEFAHIYQYNHPELGLKYKKGVVWEIHADMLAGWYMTEYLINKKGLKYSSTIDPKFDEIDDIFMDMTISFGWMGDEAYWSTQHHGNYETRTAAFLLPWRCKRGSPTRFTCHNFSDFLKTSVENAEYQIYTFDNN